MYFAKITNYQHPKNKLQDYLQKQLKALECVTVENPEEFKKHLETTVHRANGKFLRCRPLQAYFHAAYTQGDLTCGISELIQFSLYAQRGVFDPSGTSAAVMQGEAAQAELFV
ncbi:hypothetical protein GCM10023189_32750 [Nibrella saemangeumensis]|uniref:Uncharacterized protein n=1 Tax=Nibrella saemangeumensis TaxID=1084526 RepID=A0ABP8N0P7_9BACT